MKTFKMGNTEISKAATEDITTLVKVLTQQEGKSAGVAVVIDESADLGQRQLDYLFGKVSREVLEQPAELSMRAIVDGGWLSRNGSVIEAKGDQHGELNGLMLAQIAGIQCSYGDRLGMRALLEALPMLGASQLHSQLLGSGRFRDAGELQACVIMTVNRPSGGQQAITAIWREGSLLAASREEAFYIGSGSGQSYAGHYKGNEAIQAYGLIQRIVAAHEQVSDAMKRLRF